jgi:hypothetical protein
MDVICSVLKQIKFVSQNEKVIYQKHPVLLNELYKKQGLSGAILQAQKFYSLAEILIQGCGK